MLVLLVLKLVLVLVVLLLVLLLAKLKLKLRLRLALKLMVAPLAGRAIHSVASCRLHPCGWCLAPSISACQ